jgi:hypothetical protein
MIQTLLNRVPSKFIAICNNKLYPVKLCFGKAFFVYVVFNKIKGMPLGDVI